VGFYILPSYLYFLLSSCFGLRRLGVYGGADCILVVGFEKMVPGSLKSFLPDRRHPGEMTLEMTKVTRGFTDAPRTAQLFGNAGREYMEK
jgi:sterol carrier protein 2